MSANSSETQSLRPQGLRVKVTVPVAVLRADGGGPPDKPVMARLEVTASAAFSVELLYVALMMALTLPLAGVVVTLTVPGQGVYADRYGCLSKMTAVLLLDSDITAPRRSRIRNNRRHSGRAAPDNTGWAHHYFCAESRRHRQCRRLTDAVTIFASIVTPVAAATPVPHCERGYRAARRHGDRRRYSRRRIVA